MTGPARDVRTVISTSFHEEPSAIDGFCDNWLSAFNEAAHVAIHFSASSTLQSLALSARLLKRVEEGSIVVNPNSIATKWGSAMPMHYQNYLYHRSLGLSYDYFYFASPYLYAFKPNLNQYVARYDFGLPPNLSPMPADWHWKSAVETDERFAALKKYLGIQGTYIARADGIFLKRELMDEAITILLKFYQPEDFFGLKPMYPLEEVFFPLLAKSVFRHMRIGNSGAKVWEPWDKEKLTVASVENAIKSPTIICGKRIPQQEGDPIRKIVLDNIPGPKQSSVIPDMIGKSI